MIDRTDDQRVEGNFLQNGKFMLLTVELYLLGQLRRNVGAIDACHSRNFELTHGFQDALQVTHAGQRWLYHQQYKVYTGYR